MSIRSSLVHRLANSSSLRSILAIWAEPSPFDEDDNRFIRDFLDTIVTGDKANTPGIQLERLIIESTHHFHMMRPDETCRLIIEHLDKFTEIKRGFKSKL